MQPSLKLLSALLPLLVGALPGQGSVPTTLPFQGRLALQTGSAVNTTVKMVFHIYGTATGGTSRWSETHNAVAVTKGLFKVELGSVTGFGPTLFNGDDLYLGVQVATDAEMVPRVALSSQAYAQLARNAHDVKDRDIHPKSVSIGTTPVIDATGKWVGSTGGLQGPKGDTGATGPQGAKGSTGSTGPQGAKGNTGSAGPQGAKGNTGSAGPQGAKGNTGSTGATGPQGRTGSQGKTGAQGNTGPQGPKGDTGASPFVVSGSNATYTQGRIGIGLSSPSYQLDVSTTGTHGIRGVATAKTGSAHGVYGKASSTGTNYAYGVYGITYADKGRGVYGSASGTNGRGVSGIATGTKGNALFGWADNTAGETNGIYGYTNAGSGYALYANNSNGSAIFAQADNIQRYAIYAENNGVGASNRLPSGAAIEGRSTGWYGIGVRGVAKPTSSSITEGFIGVEGVAESANGGNGVYGRSYGIDTTGVRGYAGTRSGTTPGSQRGVSGTCRASTGYGVFSDGRFGATSNKGFVQPHPKDADKTVFFVCLEGNENGTYFRGKTRLVNGVAEIVIPEEWQQVSAADGVTVQITPRGASMLYVDVQTRERIVVRGAPDCEFNYFVNGVRRGFTDYTPYQKNHEFKPTIRGIPFGTQYPKELRDVLVGNGILNADYTPNEATAERLGWKLKSPDEVDPAHRYWLSPAERAALPETTRPVPPSIPQRDPQPVTER